MKVYVPDIEESYKNTFIRNMENSDNIYLVLHMVQLGMYLHLTKKIMIYLWFCTVYKLCINNVIVLDFSQPNTLKKGKNYNEILNIYTTFNQKPSAC